MRTKSHIAKCLAGSRRRPEFAIRPEASRSVSWRAPPRPSVARMIVENAYLQIIAGQESEFERAFAKALPILAAAQGCASVQLFRDAERHAAYLLRVAWERLEDHTEAFPASHAGRQFAQHVAGFLDGEPVVRHFDSVDIAE